MKLYHVSVEAPARRDIEQAELRLAKQSPTAAAGWFNSLYATIGSLEHFADCCPRAPESEFLDMEVCEIFHSRRHHKYRILFTLIENEVHVLHVRRVARASHVRNEAR